MKTMMRRGLLCALALLCVPTAHADGPVWKISDGQNTLYLGGTVHLLAPSDYPLPGSFQRAYDASAEVVLETDITALHNPALQQNMLGSLIYTDGRSLSSVLSRKTLRDLEAHLESRGIPMATMLAFKPGMLTMTLTVLELQRLGLGGTGVDQYFGQKAQRDAKQLSFLESVEQQLQFLADMGEGEEDALIAYTLRDINDLPNLMRNVKAAWRTGDTAELKQLALTPMQRDFPGVYEALVLERNNAWIPQIEAMLETRTVELVLVGALHLVGQDGVLAQLEALGYSVRRF